MCLVSLAQIVPQVAAGHGKRERKRKGILSTSFCPSIRYRPWGDLGWLTQFLGSLLGYTPRTWNFDPTLRMWNPLEDSAWDSEDVQEVRSYIMLLGYEETSWDCCINHYEDYDWDEFLTWELMEQLAALQTLGWTEDSWESTDASSWSDVDSKNWEELTDFQREMAASKLCYTKETWNEDPPLDQWPGGFDIPDTW